MKVEIYGHLDGKISAENVVIGSTGVVKGDIEFSQNLRTEDGADIEGYIKKSASAGKKESRSKVYCLCSVQMMSKKYSDRELDKIVSKGIDHLNKKTKSIAEKCAKKANAK